MNIEISETREPLLDQVIELYKANNWSAAEKPGALLEGLKHSHSLFTAWTDSRLVGLGNAISDGHLVVYYPHLLVHPDFQGKGIGRMIFAKLQEKYAGFHMQMLTADGNSIDFYEKAGFVKAGDTQSMWIYQGNEH